MCLSKTSAFALDNSLTSNPFFGPRMVGHTYVSVHFNNTLHCTKETDLFTPCQPNALPRWRSHISGRTYSNPDRANL
ncbi:uncharacterized protein LY79DRAFT_707068 [Colletotrichum navitas]|uniref:Uncharacterized protein n=1 Tax=Colletotrichum navitas TaxID=681940 RepID=A0AAD8V0P4_9PEZI|nr:uncharacterized protein LY79DRAFT_707068 [Colletotrichum navitas]KAK1573495.1 hypothetical protein LY79DRAFT_707068 [Colletotrichum navitas]